MPSSRLTLSPLHTVSLSKDSDHRTAGRVLDVLELLAHAANGLTLTDLGQELHCAKSSLFPLLKTLLSRGYVTLDSANKYCLSTRLFELGVTSTGQRDLREIARPALKLLTKRTGEAVLLAVLASDKQAVLYVDKVESEHRIRYSAGLGERRPLHSSSAGKVMLAFMQDEEQSQVLKSLKLVRYTSETITSKKALLAEIAKVRQEGVCVNADQSELGRCGIAAPIFDHNRELVAACAMGAPTLRIMNALPEMIAEVKTTAGSISRMLGYIAPSD